MDGDGDGDGDGEEVEEWEEELLVDGSNLSWGDFEKCGGCGDKLLDLL